MGVESLRCFLSVPSCLRLLPCGRSKAFLCLRSSVWGKKKSAALAGRIANRKQVTMQIIQPLHRKGLRRLFILRHPLVPKLHFGTQLSAQLHCCFGFFLATLSPLSAANLPPIVSDQTAPTTAHPTST